MIHPFMPYVTEELWQRLPHRPGDKNPTIVKAAYPRYNPELDDPAAAAAYDLVFAVVKAIRSLASEYNIKENIKGKEASVIMTRTYSNQCYFTVFVQGFDKLTYTTIQEQIPSIIALTKGLDDLQVLSAEQDHPGGCSLNAISKDCNVYLLVKGRVDVDSEIAKAQAKLVKAEETRARQEKLISSGDYKKKVKQSVQEADAEKIADLKAEAETLRQVIAKFEGLRA